MKAMLGMMIGSGSFESDGKAFEAAQRVVEAALQRARDLDGADPLRQRRQDRLAFQPGDELADAHVNAGTVADMAAGPARHIIIVWIVPSPRIAIGGGEEHQNLLALADPCPADLDLPGGGPEKCLHRAFESHRLFKRIARKRRI